MNRAATETALRIAREGQATVAGGGSPRRALGHLLELVDDDLRGAVLDVLAEVLAGELSHGPLPVDPHRRIAVLTEEVLELMQATNDHAWVSPRAAAVRAEMVQVAAVSLRMIPVHDHFTITPR